MITQNIFLDMRDHYPSTETVTWGKPNVTASYHGLSDNRYKSGIE